MQSYSFFYIKMKVSDSHTGNGSCHSISTYILIYLKSTYSRLKLEVSVLVTAHGNLDKIYTLTCTFHRSSLTFLSFLRDHFQKSYASCQEKPDFHVKVKQKTNSFGVQEKCDRDIKHQNAKINSFSIKENTICIRSMLFVFSNI